MIEKELSTGYKVAFLYYKGCMRYELVNFIERGHVCMKKLKLFYNPFSGNKSFKFDLDVCIGIFQEGGYEVHPFRTLYPGDIENHIM